MWKKKKLEGNGEQFSNPKNFISLPPTSHLHPPLVLSSLGFIPRLLACTFQTGKKIMNLEKELLGRGRLSRREIPRDRGIPYRFDGRIIISVVSWPLTHFPKFRRHVNFFFLSFFIQVLPRFLLENSPLFPIRSIQWHFTLKDVFLERFLIFYGISYHFIEIKNGRNKICFSNAL